MPAPRGNLTPLLLALVLISVGWGWRAATAGAEPAAAEPKAGDAAPATPFPWGGLGVLTVAAAGVAHVWRAGARPVPAAGLPEPESSSLHRCAVCGRTERQHPELDFRVGADGEDYCTEHAGRKG